MTGYIVKQLCIDFCMFSEMSLSTMVLNHYASHVIIMYGMFNEKMGLVDLDTYNMQLNRSIIGNTTYPTYIQKYILVPFSCGVLILQGLIPNRATSSMLDCSSHFIFSIYIEGSCCYCC